ncbi:MAG: Eco57I restriction-modification methylase domain-containing protein [Pseudomonadota bacterium]
MFQMLESVDSIRQVVARGIQQRQKSDLGQFMTPANVARFMASLFPSSHLETARLLDAGAGVGSLSSAFLDRWAAGGFHFKRVEVCAYEVDNTIRGFLADTLTAYADRLPIGLQIVPDDFIESAVHGLYLASNRREFTHAILNPPYKKINSNSRHRSLLRQAGIETVNLYTAFVALAVDLLAPGGHLVAIIPRSFCNGPYYRPFREFILSRTAIKYIHLFDARNKAFKEDKVLQENIIIALERSAKQEAVTISTSTDDTFVDFVSHDTAFRQMVHKDDEQKFIHIPLPGKNNATGVTANLVHSLVDIGVGVSTGPVVDFRLREQLRSMPGPGTVPLLYSGHFVGQSTKWPQPDMKKPNAIMHNKVTEKWLYPNGFYAVVRRFSSKEEKRRIVASVVEPTVFGYKYLGFENHLNVFHHGKQGLPELLARGLATFLNSTVVDETFRRFNGHTQVNATDLRQMKYPSREALISLGRWAKAKGEVNQGQIDEKVSAIL